jgi:hypothetical protein
MHKAQVLQSLLQKPLVLSWWLTVADGDPVPVWATKHGHGKAGAAQDNTAFNDYNLPRGEDWIVSEL